RYINRICQTVVVETDHSAVHPARRYSKGHHDRSGCREEDCRVGTTIGSRKLPSVGSSLFAKHIPKNGRTSEPTGSDRPTADYTSFTNNSHVSASTDRKNNARHPSLILQRTGAKC